MSELPVEPSIANDEAEQSHDELTVSPPESEQTIDEASVSHDDIFDTPSEGAAEKSEGHGLQVFSYDDMSEVSNAKGLDFFGEESEIDEMFDGLFGDDNALFGGAFGDDAEELSLAELDVESDPDVDVPETPSVSSVPSVPLAPEAPSIPKTPELSARDRNPFREDGPSSEVEVPAMTGVGTPDATQEDVFTAFDDDDILASEDVAPIAFAAESAEQPADDSDDEISFVAFEQDEVSDDDINDALIESDSDIFDDEPSVGDALVAASESMFAEPEPDDEPELPVETSGDELFSADDSQENDLFELSDADAGGVEPADSVFDAHLDDDENINVEPSEPAHLPVFEEFDVDEPEPVAFEPVETPQLDPSPTKRSDELDALLGNIDAAPEHDHNIRLGTMAMPAVDETPPSLAEGSEHESLEFLLAAANRDIESKRADEEEPKRDILDELLGDDLPPPPPEGGFNLPPVTPSAKPKKGGFMSKIFGKD